MKFTLSEDVLRVSEIDELATATATSFQSELSAALPAQVRQIDIDLSQTEFVDCGGLGALVGLRKSARTRNGELRIRVLNPPKPVRRMLALTGMDRAFAVDQHAFSPAVT